ncbi:MAG TPA: DsbA family protein [Solimonas sp.]|nr:DsbA family protein [Solimonas sp.]
MSRQKLPLAGLAPSFKSRIAERIAASRDPVARLRASTELELYYEAGDPHSQLCAALARTWAARLRRPLRIHLVPTPDPQTYPEEARQRAFAATDAARLAPCHGLASPVALGEADRAALAARLAATNTAEAFLACEAAALAAVTAQRPMPGPVADAAATASVQQAGQRRRERLGHYLPAMWQYRGEWFWALDRLETLEQRLRADGMIEDAAPLSRRDPACLPPQPEADPAAALEFWFSFRSPYSYLAAVELLEARRRGLYPRLQVRPVLPMVMRGLPVPRLKRLYIVRDVKRCADAAGIPFGRIHDPVGEGVLRLLTVFPYEADADTQLRYCAIAGQTVWAEGLDVRRDEVLHSVIARSGLAWAQAQRTLAGGTDTRRAEAHRDALFAAGLWGVPSFRLGGFTTWGQDRLWMLERVTAAVAP